MLVVPLLVLTPLYLRLERGHRLKRQLALALAFMLLVLLATLSRSGAARARRRPARARDAVPAVPALARAARAARRRRAACSRTSSTRAGTTSRSCSARASRRAARRRSTHFAVYDFIPQILHSHPLFGLGLNNFSVYYEFVTGKTNWGPHSFWVALIVETGLVGLLLFVVFLRYVFLRLRAARALGTHARRGARSGGAACGRSRGG